MDDQKTNSKPLTLDKLIDYNQKALFPVLEERLTTKKELQDFKEEFKDFENKSLTFQDIMLKKMDILLDEKEVRNYQEGKEKKLWTIIINALKEHRILSQRELREISQLEVF